MRHPTKTLNGQVTNFISIVLEELPKEYTTVTIEPSTILLKHNNERYINIYINDAADTINMYANNGEYEDLSLLEFMHKFLGNIYY